MAKEQDATTLTRQTECVIVLVLLCSQTLSLTTEKYFIADDYYASVLSHEHLSHNASYALINFQKPPKKYSFFIGGREIMYNYSRAQ